MIETVLYGVALPALAALIVLMVGWRPWQRTPAFGAWSGPVAFGAAFMISYAAEAGAPRVPPAERWQWIVPLALAAVVIDGLLSVVRRRSSSAVPGVIACIVVGGAATFMLRLPDLDGWPARGAVGVLVAVVAGAMDFLAGRRRGLLLPVAFALALATVSGLIMLAHNAKLAVIAGGLSAAAAAAAVPLLLARDTTPLRGGALVLGALVVSLAACGFAYDYGDVGLGPFALPVCGLLVLALCEASPVPRLRGVLGWVVRLAPVIIACAGAIAWVLLTGDPPATNGADTFDYSGY